MLFTQKNVGIVKTMSWDCTWEHLKSHVYIKIIWYNQNRIMFSNFLTFQSGFALSFQHPRSCKITDWRLQPQKVADSRTLWNREEKVLHSVCLLQLWHFKFFLMFFISPFHYPTSSTRRRKWEECSNSRPPAWLCLQIPSLVPAKFTSPDCFSNRVLACYEPPSPCRISFSGRTDHGAQKPPAVLL